MYVENVNLLMFVLSVTKWPGTHIDNKSSTSGSRRPCTQRERSCSLNSILLEALNYFVNLMTLSPIHLLYSVD
jgi:hypothetical protein